MNTPQPPNPSRPAPGLAAAITRAASKQTYFTIRFLVDRDRVGDAYKAYAYFRWLDDRLDHELPDEAGRIAFVERQAALLAACYRGERPSRVSAEEGMLVELIRGDRENDSGLQAYTRHMMAVMAFDARRRGRLIGQEQLSRYSRWLATAVTEALHHFIGHGAPAPRRQGRYLAAIGAHVTHMLRDTLEDLAAGYYNMPREYLEAQGISPQEVESRAYRAWVKGRVRLARGCFEGGKHYLAQVGSLRCRMAGYAYIARFEGVLDSIEREGYRLRPDYSDRKSLKAGMALGWSALWLALLPRRPGMASPAMLVK